MRRRSATNDELRLWRFAMRDAEPMPGRRFREEEPAPPPPPVPPPVATPGPLSTSAPNPRPVPQPPPLTPGVIHGVDGRTADRLRRGRLEIDGRIDLHGMTQTQAHTALASYIHRCWNEGRRCVLVITGKGAYSPTGGVLRQAVPRWLAEPVLARMVLAIQPAQPMHGGDGALYVLVKRRREAERRRG